MIIYLISFSSFSHSSSDISSSFSFSKHFEYFEKIVCIFYFFFSPHAEYFSFFLLRLDKYFSPIPNILNISSTKLYSSFLSIQRGYFLRFLQSYRTNIDISELCTFFFFYIHAKSQCVKFTVAKKHWCLRQENVDYRVRTPSKF